MEELTGFESWLLEKLNPDFAVSPEEFIISIEEQLDAGEISEDEAIDMIRDFIS